MLVTGGCAIEKLVCVCVHMGVHLCTFMLSPFYIKRDSTYGGASSVFFPVKKMNVASLWLQPDKGKVIGLTGGGVLLY